MLTLINSKLFIIIYYTLLNSSILNNELLYYSLLSLRTFVLPFVLGIQPKSDKEIGVLAFTMSSCKKMGLFKILSNDILNSSVT